MIWYNIILERKLIHKTFCTCRDFIVSASSRSFLHSELLLANRNTTVVKFLLFRSWEIVFSQNDRCLLILITLRLLIEGCSRVYLIAISKSSNYVQQDYAPLDALKFIYCFKLRMPTFIQRDWSAFSNRFVMYFVEECIEFDISKSLKFKNSSGHIWILQIP